jgi:hypothetical protein
MRSADRTPTNHKLTEADVAQIRRRLALGDKPRIVAADYHMAAETIRKIGRGEMWPHVKAATRAAP